MDDFYKKRINKILPFFLFMSFIEIIYQHSFSSVIEGFANSTLLFSFISKELTVIGVGWFIGLVFIFYIMFPYFTYLFSNKKRAWIVMLISILMHYSSLFYFNIGKENMFSSFMWFCVGGILFLYKESIINFFNNKKTKSLILLFLAIITYYIIPINNIYLRPIRVIFLSTAALVYSISNKSFFLDNKVTKIISDNSFEIYLGHMFIYRILEKLNLFYKFNNTLITYVLTFILVFCGSIFLSIIFNFLYKKCEKFIDRNKTKKLDVS